VSREITVATARHDFAAPSKKKNVNTVSLRKLPKLSRPMLFHDSTGYMFGLIVMAGYTVTPYKTSPLFLCYDYL
jgi:hypothetical protein